MIFFALLGHPALGEDTLSQGSGRDQGTGDASGVALMSLINILG